MRISSASENAPGRVNEDLVASGPDWVAVLDGATAPDGVDSGCIHDVAWLVHHLAAGIADRMLSSSWEPLGSVLASAIKRTCEEHAGTCDLSNPDSPSSTVSIVRLRDGVLDYLVLGDSPVVLAAHGEAVEPIVDDRTAHLPGGRPYSPELVRSLRNQPGGFWVASTNPEAAREAIAGSVPVAERIKIGMFTDGVSRLVDFYGYSWGRVMSLMETDGPAWLIARVREMERNRPLANAKQHDDASAVLVSTGSLAKWDGDRKSWPVNWRTLAGL